MSQQYLLPCGCGQKVRIEPAQAGGRVSCGCGQSLAVPTLRGLRSLEIAPAQVEKSTPGWSRTHGVVFAVSLLVAAAGLAMVGVYTALYFEAMNHTTDRTDEVIRNYDKSNPIDALTPAAALAEWKTEVLPGLRHEFHPEWVAAKAAASLAMSRIRIGLLLLAGGLVPAIATLFIGREAERSPASQASPSA